MTIILPTGIGFILGRVFIPREAKPKYIDNAEIETAAKKETPEEDPTADPIPTAA